MKKYIIITGFISLICFVSCKKPENENTLTRISKIVLIDLENIQDSVVFKFDYSIAHTIKVKESYEGDFSWTIFRFDDLSRLSEIQSKNSADILTYLSAFSYTSNKAICKRISYENQNLFLEDSIIYTLENNGTVSQADHYSSPDLIGPDLQVSYTWQDGNIIQLVGVGDIYSSNDTIRFTYGTGLNPLQISNLPIGYPEGGDDAFLLCGTHYALDAKNGNDMEATTESIEYNSDNYPTKIVKYLPGFSNERFKYLLEYETITQK